MKRLWLQLFCYVIAFASATGTVAHANERFDGIWRNPEGSVHIRAEPCGANMCGVVIWANDQARNDAVKGSGMELVGSTLFRDFRPDKRSGWRGQVYVPDVGKTFSGTIILKDVNHLEGKGCLLGRFFCKSQIWKRVQAR